MARAARASYTSEVRARQGSVLFLAFALAACHRISRSASGRTDDRSSALLSPPARREAAAFRIFRLDGDGSSSTKTSDAGPEPEAPTANPEDAGAHTAAIGPFSVRFHGSRKMLYVAADEYVFEREPQRPRRLIAGLHGVCTPPSLICGAWAHAASQFGSLVCPSGDGVCDGGYAPTWNEPWSEVDRDLERAVTELGKHRPGSFTRTGSVLMGFSRGAYIAPRIAHWHPGRWPYLVLNEADVSLSAPALRRAGVRAVALFAGEWGSLVPSLRRTEKALLANGFPARLWIMKRAGHHYSEDIDLLMREALDWLVGHDAGSDFAEPDR